MSSRLLAGERLCREVQYTVRATFALSLLLGLAACSTEPRNSLDNLTFHGAPYPQSRYITAVTWDFSAMVNQRKAHGSDLWPCTWAADGNLYCAWGDGGGFDGDSENFGRTSLGFARIEGMPTTAEPGGFAGKNVWGAAPEYAEHQATFGGKVESMISVNGTLYAYARLWTERDTSDPVHRNEAGPLPTLIWSQDLGSHWQIALWENTQLGSFLNFGQDNAGALDSFVYIYYKRLNDNSRVYLKRVPKTMLTADPATSDAYEYLTGVNWRCRPKSWSKREGDARAIFSDPRGAEVEVVYDAPLRRFLLVAAHNPGGTEATASAGQVGLFEAPHPWGPWATIGYYDNWGDLGPESHGDYLGVTLPTKWISEDGLTLWGIFSSLGQYDSFNIVKATLAVAPRAAR